MTDIADDLRELLHSYVDEVCKAIDEKLAKKIERCDPYYDLKGDTITKAEYAECQKIWKERGMTRFRDWLVYYNNLDVNHFLEAL